MQVRLIVVKGKNKAREVTVELPAVLGRSAGAAVVIRDEGVSREHCRLYESGGVVMIQDTSTNGTLLDGKLVSEAVVQSGSHLTIGPVTLLAIYQKEGDTALQGDASTVAAMRPIPRAGKSDTEVSAGPQRPAKQVPPEPPPQMPLLPPTADGSPTTSPPPAPAAKPTKRRSRERRFDPYAKWFGIPPEEQPPNHYRLLGLPTFESDRGAIEDAADQRMTQVRQYQLGPHADQSRQIFGEIAKAKLCLLDAARKETYDAVLRNAQSHAPASGNAEGEAPAPPPAPGGPTVGERFGAYRIMDRIASSASGPLYKAQLFDTGELVTLKLLSAEHANHPQLLQRFQQEAELAARLDHPNIVVALGSGEVHGTHYLVLEYVEGTHLANLVKVQGPLPVSQAIQYTVQAARGLGYLHEHGVVHRNIKPHNLLVDVRGTVKITNLMLARLEEGSVLADAGPSQTLTASGAVIGSVDYMAPEQATKPRDIDRRVDIYALGCTLYHILTGGPPYRGGSTLERLAAHQSEPIPSLRAARPEVPETVDRVFQKMLAKNPAERYQTAEEVIVDLA